MSDHPPRDPLLGALVDAARAYGPSAEQLDRIAQGLPLQGARVSAIRRRRSRWGEVRSPRALALIAAAAALPAIAAAILLGTRPTSRPPEPPLARASADWPASMPSALPSSEPIAPEPVAAPAIEPSRNTPAAKATAVKRPSAPRAEHRRAPPTLAEVPDAGAAASSLPTMADAGPLPVASDVESDLLERAAIVIDRNPTEALRLADQHLASFPAGALSNEREVLAIQALLLLGRDAEARARGTRFLQQNPSSPRRRLIEGLLAQ